MHTPTCLLDHNGPAKVSVKCLIPQQLHSRSLVPNGWLPRCALPTRQGHFQFPQIRADCHWINMMQRRGNRVKAVLPIRIKGKDSLGKSFEELAHTLDVTAQGARLGSVRHELNVKDEITIFYRQRKIQFRVVWIKKMKGTSEFQVGLQAATQDKEAWGLGSQESQTASITPLSAAHAHGLA